MSSAVVDKNAAALERIEEIYESNMDKCCQIQAILEDLEDKRYKACRAYFEAHYNCQMASIQLTSDREEQADIAIALFHCLNNNPDFSVSLWNPFGKFISRIEKTCLEFKKWSEFPQLVREANMVLRTILDQKDAFRDATYEADYND
jgi:hypothetical protein